MAEADAQQFLALLHSARDFVLTTHVSPDGDGIGSELGLAWLLRAGGGNVRIVNVDPTPPRLAFLDPRGTIERYDPLRHDELIAGSDVIVMLDNADPQRLGVMRAVVERARGRKVCIDHHPDPPPFWDLLLLRTAASSTGEIVAELIQHQGLVPDRNAAGALLTAIVSDTGRFRFANSTAAAFAAAAWLTRAGASAAEIYAQVEQGVSRVYCRLMGHALSTMELHESGRLVILRLPQAVIGTDAVDGEELARIINEALSLDGCRVAALFRELGPSETKVSLRSVGTIDVQKLAKAQGGGGHRNASGVVVAAGLEAAVTQLLAPLRALVGAEP